jgi:hypothetical protein
MSDPVSIAVLSLLGGLIGGAAINILGHFLSDRRDTRNKRREIIVQNLIEIFEAFDSSTLTDPMQEKIALEKAVSKIQLYGDEALVKLSSDFLIAMKNVGSCNTDTLMRKLRDEIRSELGLSRLSTNFVILRYDEISPPQSSNLPTSAKG